MSTTITYTYDKSQRLTTQASSSGESHYFTHNQRNMATQIQDVGGSADTLRTFTYNAIGERTFGIDGTASPSYWSYDGGIAIRENFNASNSRYRMAKGVLAEYDSVDGSTFGYAVLDQATSVKTLEASATPPGNNYYEYDAPGDRIAVTDNFGGSPPNRMQFAPSLGLLRLKTTQETYLGLAGLAFFPAQALVSVGEQVPPAPVVPLHTSGQSDSTPSDSQPVSYTWEDRGVCKPWLVLVGFEMGEYGAQNDNAGYDFNYRITAIGSHMNKCSITQKVKYDVDAYDFDDRYNTLGALAWLPVGTEGVSVSTAMNAWNRDWGRDPDWDDRYGDPHTFRFAWGESFLLRRTLHIPTRWGRRQAPWEGLLPLPFIFNPKVGIPLTIPRPDKDTDKEFAYGAEVEAISEIRISSKAETWKYHWEYSWSNFPNPGAAGNTKSVPMQPNQAKFFQMEGIWGLGALNNALFR